jgi:alpha-L-fucosidase
MDWHHPDYFPKRPWERESPGGTGLAPQTSASFNNYNHYLNNQVTELLTNYGPIGVMWFDGQWEGTWNHTRGQALYNLCRQLQPSVIVNNRCDRGGNLGSINGPMEPGVKPAGDYLTPEQEIPDTGLPGDWETCMTINDHWGYNKNDHHYKSTKDLIHKLADIASKGGNFLLNIGPTSEGEFPPEALDRLHEIGQWMATNGESIHGTQASPFEKPFAWGRCTQRNAAPAHSTLSASEGSTSPRPSNITRLYLHVFDWPKDGKLAIPGVFNEPRTASLLGDKPSALPVTRGGDNYDSLIIDVPMTAPDPIDSVIALDIVGLPNTARTPSFVAADDLFVDSLSVTPVHPGDVLLHYTLDGSDPTMQSSYFQRQPFAVDHPGGVHASGVQWPALTLRQTTTVSARPFMKGNGTPAGPISRRTFTKVTSIPAISTPATTRGLHYEYFEGDWTQLPNFTAMKPQATGIAHDLSCSQHPTTRIDRFGFRFHGYYTAPQDGVYTFHLASDDGSNLYLDGTKLINNDGLHSLEEKSGSVALAKGPHALTIDFFEKTGGHELDLAVTIPNAQRKPLNADDLTTEAETGK